MNIWIKNPTGKKISNFRWLLNEFRANCSPEFKEQFSEIETLFQIADTIPIENTECERGFSYEKMVVTPLRTSLTPDHIEDFSMISMEIRRKFGTDLARILELVPRARFFYQKRIKAERAKRVASSSVKAGKAEEVIDVPEEDRKHDPESSSSGKSISSLFPQKSLDERLNAGARGKFNAREKEQKERELAQKAERALEREQKAAAKRKAVEIRNAEKLKKSKKSKQSAKQKKPLGNAT